MRSKFKTLADNDDDYDDGNEDDDENGNHAGNLWNKGSGTLGAD